MSSYRDAAVILWGEAGDYAHTAYSRWRPLRPELPDELPIVIGITAYGACIGLTRGHWESGPRITIFSGLFKRGRHRVDDTMAHEMLHSWLIVTENVTSDDDSHGAAWSRSFQGRHFWVRVRRPGLIAGGWFGDLRRVAAGWATELR